MTRYTLPDQGWSWMILLASFGSHCIHGFFLTAVGLLQLSLLDHYKENVFKTSLALSIFLGLFSTSGQLFLQSLPRVIVPATLHLKPLSASKNYLFFIQ
jgi:hypothetical protein